MNTRELALDILLELERGRGYSNLLLRSVLDKYDYLPAQEKAFLKRLAEGVVERRIELDYVLDQVSRVPADRMKPLIRCLLRMGVYQLLYMDAVPDSAACNEAVKLAEKRGFHHLKGFVNGVLRAVGRQKGRIAYPDRREHPAAYLSVAFSVPEELVRLLLAEYAPEVLEAMFAAMQQAQPVSVRFRAACGEVERKKYLDAMRGRGIDVEPSPYLDSVWLLRGAEGVASLPGYAEGAFAVQDVSSALAVEVAGIRSGDFVLDVCAAPGGKALYAAEKAARVLARDIGAGKLALLAENAGRLHAGNLTAQEWDAGIPDESLKEKADVVLMDVPCSGLGVLGKKRDIKYHVTAEGLRSLEALQKRIAENCWQYVRPGGVLLYSTCTIRRAENQEMCRYICEHFPFAPESMEEYLPERLAGRAKEGCLQLLPGKDACDGFFFARLRRKA